MWYFFRRPDGCQRGHQHFPVLECREGKVPRRSHSPSPPPQRKVLGGVWQRKAGPGEVSGGEVQEDQVGGCGGAAGVCGGAAVVCGGAAVACGGAAVACGGAAVVCGGAAVVCGGAAVACGGAAVVCVGASAACYDVSVIFHEASDSAMNYVIAMFVCFCLPSSKVQLLDGAVTSISGNSTDVGGMGGCDF